MKSGSLAKLLNKYQHNKHQHVIILNVSKNMFNYPIMKILLTKITSNELVFAQHFLLLDMYKT